jgi:hypothetical protein
VKRLIVPPLPAASRPSNRTTILVPEFFSQFPWTSVMATLFRAELTNR